MGTSRTRVIGDVPGNYHPHGDSSVYDALVRLVQPWSMRYPLLMARATWFAGNDPGCCAPLHRVPTVAAGQWRWSATLTKRLSTSPRTTTTKTKNRLLPSRFPNLLANGSAGIAVGMATNIPPHNLREPKLKEFSGRWPTPDAPREQLLEELIARIPGPDFPTGALIVGVAESTTRTARVDRSRCVPSSTSRKTTAGRTCLVITEPASVNPDNLSMRIAELANDGKITGIAGSSR